MAGLKLSTISLLQITVILRVYYNPNANILFQWTAKNTSAAVKINGGCDDVMILVMKRIDLDIPEYKRCVDVRQSERMCI